MRNPVIHLVVREMAFFSSGIDELGNVVESQVEFLSAPSFIGRKGA